MEKSRNGLALAGGLLVGSIIGWGAVAVAHADQEPISMSPPDVIADSLIGLWIDSVGGMATYERFDAASYTITTVIYDTLSGRIMRTRPRYAWVNRHGPYGEEARVERWESYGFIAQGFNGQDKWATLDGVLLPDTAKDWREARYVAGDLSYWPALPFKLRDAGVFLNYGGMTSRPGAEFRADPSRPAIAPPPNGYHDVVVTFGEDVGEKQDTWHYYFEPDKGFPVEVTYQEEARPNINRMIWGETARVGMIQYPYVVRRDFITASGKRNKTLILSDVVINPEIPQAMFEWPERP